MLSLGRLLKPLVGVSHKEATSFSEGNSKTWQHLETAVLAAIGGYHATLEDSRLEILVPRLNEVEPELRGYAYEGAAIGLTGLDCLMPWKKRLQEFLDGPGSSHTYMIHIGAGEALARLRRQPERFLSRLDPVLRWMVMDGYGFHEGFFARHRYIEQQAPPAHLSPYACRVFDQGLGRSCWFLAGANVERMAAMVSNFPPTRQADLWIGVGVGCAYAGGVDRAAIETLRQAAGSYLPRLALGAAVVAKGRLRAGNPVPHSDLACEVLCGLSREKAAYLVDVAFQNLPTNGVVPAYEILQQRLELQFAGLAEHVDQRKEAV
jgi:hypothetical protein